MARQDQQFVNRTIQKNGRAAALRRAYVRAWEALEEKYRRLADPRKFKTPETLPKPKAP